MGEAVVASRAGAALASLAEQNCGRGLADNMIPATFVSRGSAAT